MKIYDLSSGSNAIQYFTLTAYEMSSTEIDPFKKLEGSMTTMYNAAKTFDISQEYSEFKKTLEKASDGIVEYSTLLLQGKFRAFFGKTLDDLQKVADNIDEIFGETFKNIDGGAEASGDPVAMWILPLPLSLQVTLKHNYEPDEITPEQMIDRALIKKGNLMLTSTARELFPGAPEHLKKAAKFGVEVARRYNYSFDPSQINVYKGTNGRSVTLPFRLTPMSDKHAEDILEGILQLKSMMTGEQILTDGMFVKQPYCFKIDFNNDYLNKWIGLTDSDVNITNVNTNLFAELSAPTYDGMTKGLVLSISVSERRPPRNKE